MCVFNHILEYFNDIFSSNQFSNVFKIFPCINISIFRFLVLSLSFSTKLCSQICVFKSVSYVFFWYCPCLARLFFFHRLDFIIKFLMWRHSLMMVTNLFHSLDNFMFCSTVCSLSWNLTVLFSFTTIYNRSFQIQIY